MASSGIEGLAGVVTAPLGQIGAIAQPVTDGLRDVWAGYFGSSVPSGGTNWNAYTHQQLYDMLQQNADVADVGSIADQWDQHGAELADQTEQLRDRQAALEPAWTGDASDSAHATLGSLGDQTQAIGARAATVGLITRQAADALALARNTMPPPLADEVSTVVNGAVSGAGVGSAIGSAVGGDFTGGFGAAPGAVMGGAIGAVAGGAASMFLAAVDAGQGKAEAVHVMQTYEGNLVDAANAMPAAGADTVTTPSSVAGGGTADGVGGADGRSAGVPWHELVGSSPGVAPVRSGAMSGALTDATLTRAGLLPAEDEMAASTDTPEGTYQPGVWRGRRGEDEEHRIRLPRRFNDPFGVDGDSVVAVIGGTDQ